MARKKNQEKIVLEYDCLICGEHFVQTNKFSAHLFYTHKITPEEYTLRYLCNGIRPVCKYCGEETEFWPGKFMFKAHCPKHGNEYRKEWSRENGFGAKVDQRQALGKTKENYEYLQRKSEEMTLRNQGLSKEEIFRRTKLRLQTEKERNSRRLKVEKYEQYCEKAKEIGLEILTPYEEMQKRVEVVMCRCLVCGAVEERQNANIQTSIKNKTMGCRACIYQQRADMNADKFRMPQEVYEAKTQEVFERGLKVITPYKNYKNGHAKVDYICLKCGYEGRKVFLDLSRGGGCYHCNKMGTSKFEEAVYAAFVDKGYNVIKNYRLYEDHESDKRKYKEIDVYFPDYKIGLECDGLYWHSSKEKEKDYHAKKQEYCKMLGINLVSIYEDEWDEHPDLILSIIDSKCRKGYEVDSSVCTVDKIDLAEVEEFCEDNWLEDLNWVLQKDSYENLFNFGLFFYDKLVAVISCYGNKDGTVLLRNYCVRKGFILNNVFQILLKNIVFEIKNNNSKYINYKTFEVYSDARLRKGREFIVNGFDIKELGVENWFYTDYENRYPKHYDYVDNINYLLGKGEDYFNTIHSVGINIYQRSI